MKNEETSIAVMELVNPSDYGIDNSKAEELVSNLPNILSERNVLVAQYDEVVRMDIDSSITTKRAKELRVLIKNNRTKGIEVWHKNAKDYFLNGGRFVDAIKRMEVAVNERMEDALEAIEKHAEIKEAKRIEELNIERVAELQNYMEFVPIGINLGQLSEEEYGKIYNGAKLQTEAKIQAELKAEKERIAKEKAEAKAIELQRKENERLKAEAEKREKELEAERKANELKLEQERAKAKAIQDAKDKLEAEIKAKKDAEELAIKKAKLEEEKLAKAPIKNRLNAWVDSFQIPDINTDVEQKQQIVEKFNAFKDWAKTIVEKI